MAVDIHSENIAGESDGKKKAGQLEQIECSDPAVEDVERARLAA